MVWLKNGQKEFLENSWPSRFFRTSTISLDSRFVFDLAGWQPPIFLNIYFQFSNVHLLTMLPVNVTECQYMLFKFFRWLVYWLFYDLFFYLLKLISTTNVAWLCIRNFRTISVSLFNCLYLPSLILSNLKAGNHPCSLLDGDLLVILLDGE